MYTVTHSLGGWPSQSRNQGFEQPLRMFLFWKTLIIYELNSHWSFHQEISPDMSQFFSWYFVYEEMNGEQNWRAAIFLAEGKKGEKKRRWMGSVQKILAFCAKLEQPRILGEERYAAAARERGGVLQWKKKKCNFFYNFQIWNLNNEMKYTTWKHKNSIL